MPRLPPVPISPHTRLRARFWPGVTKSVVTFFHPHSSSSATSWARPVSVPWPISERAIRIWHELSGLTTTHALTSVPGVAARFASAVPMNGRLNPSASPEPAAAVLTMNLRRERLVALSLMIFFMIAPSRLRFGFTVGAAGELLGRPVHARAHALIRSAAADVGHRFVDVLVARIRIFPQQRRGRHDLARLAIAALRHVEFQPRLLHRMRALRRQALDRDDFVGRFHRADGNRARAPHFAVDVHGTRAALRDAATIFGAGESDLLANHPQERRVVFDAHVPYLAVDIELCHF